MEQHHNIELRSDEVKEILGTPPGWIIRRGITIIFMVVVVFLVGSWFFKYPDIINSPVVVTTQNPPVGLVARSTGQIQHLYIKDNQKVKQGNRLGIIENPADYNQVLNLKKQLALFQNFFTGDDSLETFVFTSNILLGELQQDYSTFLKQIDDYRYFLKLNYYPRKIVSLEEQIKVVSAGAGQIRHQAKSMKHEYEIAAKQFERDSLLYKKEVLPLSEYESSKSALFSIKSDMEGTLSDLSEMEYSRAELEGRIIDTEKEFSDTQNSYLLKIKEAYNNLTGNIAGWELKYMLTAPVDGTVSFNKYWSKTQNVKEGDIVMTIIPELSSEITGRVELPIRGSGKVKVGQKVNVKFDNYPYMEYGMVRAYINNISLVPTNNVYMVELKFPEGLVTNYNVPLELNRELQGSAEIITDDLRLLQRFFNPIKALFKEKILD